METDILPGSAGTLIPSAFSQYIDLQSTLRLRAIRTTAADKALQMVSTLSFGPCVQVKFKFNSISNSVLYQQPPTWEVGVFWQGNRNTHTRLHTQDIFRCILTHKTRSLKTCQYEAILAYSYSGYGMFVYIITTGIVLVSNKLQLYHNFYFNSPSHRIVHEICSCFSGSRFLVDVGAIFCRISDVCFTSLALGKKAWLLQWW